MKLPGSSKKHGGSRSGAGRPATVKQYSERVKKNWLAAAKQIAKETGKTIEEHLLRMLIDPATQDTAKIGIGKLYNEALLIKESEQTIHDTRQGPTIGLPPIMDKPKQEEEEAR